jgi:N6-L-threonylcarbamoyladenine synthase
MWRTVRERADRLILAIETSCDDTVRRVVTADGEIALERDRLAGLLHARYGGVVPEIASRHHLELVDAVTADALERAGARSTTSTRSRSRAGRA